VERAEAGEAGTVLVAGEAGIGKTRLLEELAGWARARGCRVLVGGCVSLSAEVAPFAPIIEALRPLPVELGPDLPAILGANAGGLASLLPDVEPAGQVTGATGISPDNTQGRMLELLLGMLGRLADRSPVVLVVEDIHWADRSTVDVLAFLARNLRTQPVLLVASFRTDEPQARGQLLPFIAEMGRQPRSRRIDLARLNRAEVAEQLSAILGVEAGPDLIEQVYARSQGNAFFSEELLAAEPIAGAMPQTLRDVLLARVGALSQDAGELVRIASAAGRRFSEFLLTRLTDADEDTFHAALREAIDHQILVRDQGSDGDRLGFRHALVQELLYADLLASERVRLHAACARAIEEHMADEPTTALTSELAYHWQAADEPERALHASIAAALGAESAAANKEAALQFERAIQLLDRLPEAATGLQLDAVALLEHAAANQLENPDRAVEHIQRAIGLVDPAHEPVRAGTLRAALGRYLWFSGDGTGALAACREAVRLVPAEPPTTERAQVTAGLGQILMILTHSEEAVAVTSEAVRLAAAVGAKAVESHALNTLGVLNAYLGDVEGGLAMLRRALEIAVDIGSDDDIGRAYANLQDVLIVTAAGFDEAAEIGLQTTDPTSDRNVSGVWMGVVLTYAAWAQYLAGQWDEALKSLERARLHGMDVASAIEWEIRMASLLVGRGQFRDARRRLDQLAQLLEGAADTQWIAPTAVAEAELAIWLGDPARASASVTAGLARVQAAFGANVSRIGPMLAIGVRAAADLAERGRPSAADNASAREQAAGHLAQMEAIRDEIRVRWPVHLRLADPWLMLCRAECSRLEGPSDPEAWSSAVDLLQQVSMPYPSAYARFREGEALLAARRGATRARSALREAHATASALGASPLLAAVEGVARRGRVALDEHGEARGRGAGPSGLTTREQEILALIVGGLTNREIGERLFITEKTASHHVSSILAKLGVRGRAEAAAEAVRLGLSVPPPSS
jgi:DNA-binding CsgD family transcriptional regulator